MSEKKVVIEGDSWDNLKLALVLVTLLGGIVGFYYFPEGSKLARVFGVVFAVVIAASIFSRTQKGVQVMAFIREAQIEVRKVVWPTRAETLQTTMFVMIVVVIFAILLWVLDLILSGIIQNLIGTGA